MLAPTAELVSEVFSSAGDDAAWSSYASKYRELLDQRYGDHRAAFDRIATFARWHDVFLGCSCPSRKNPDVQRCHTMRALEFFAEKYPDLKIVF